VTLGDLIVRVRDYNPGADLDMVERAYRFAETRHEGQKRQSGEPYVTHPLAVAGILAEMRLDVPAVVTGLLHDTVEDTSATLEDLEADFGVEVAALVNGVTKINKLETDSFEEAQAETLRKMLVASVEDIRVLMIKLADRAHNLRTLGALPQAKQRRVAAETLELYAPLAHRLGINWLKAEFEETCFRTLEPQAWEDVREKLSLQRLEREGYIDEIIALLSKRLEAAGLDAQVNGRTKNAYSIHRKMTDQGLKYDEIYDVVAFRVLVDSDRDCYDALGTVHMNWRPVPGRFRDYVALPKGNRYQSLHTTVIGPYGERMEVQMRSHEMHRVAEFGVAAHWRYKSPDGREDYEADRFMWLRQLMEWQQTIDDPHEFLSGVKEDLFADEVHVFTPQGDTISLKKGYTALDFAYHIHSELGDQCAAAKVNGKLVPLRYQLQQGDTVEIVATDDTRPTRDWLKFVRSHRARDRILAHTRTQERLHAEKLGRELLERDLLTQHYDIARLQREGRLAELPRRFAREGESAFFEALGFGRITSRQVLLELFPDQVFKVIKPRRRLSTLFGLLEKSRRSMVMSDEVDASLFRVGKCCEPLPGEPIVGFLTRGRGVTVHASACPRLDDAENDRRVEVHWAKGVRANRELKLEVTSRDRPGLLAGLSQAIASAGLNIEKAYVRTIGDNAVNVFETHVANVQEFERVLRNLRRVPGVKDVKRIFG
jgi:guanosine-3',5'-bis(diphosphate) 3'-pyrophosphohydrolase